MKQGCCTEGHAGVAAGGRSCPLTGMELSGTVRMRYDPERRTAVMAWLAHQGLDISNIPRLAKNSPTPQASEGGAYLTLSCT